MDYNEYAAKLNELESQKPTVKRSLVDQYLIKRQELTKLADDFIKIFGGDIETVAAEIKVKPAKGSTKAPKVPVIITENDLVSFIEAVSENPNIDIKDLKVKLNKHPKTLQKILKIYNNSDKTLEALKIELKVA